MDCPYCDNSLEQIDEYRLYCDQCFRTFTVAMPCPRCASEILEVWNKNKLLCPRPECPSHAPIMFNSPSQLREALVPYNSPPLLPKSERLQWIHAGQLAFCKIGGADKELDIVIEIPSDYKHAYELLWQYDLDKFSLAVMNQIVNDPWRVEIVLDELRDKTVIEVHGRKSVRRYLIITFQLQPRALPA